MGGGSAATGETSGPAASGSAAANRLAGSGGTLGDTLQELQGRADQLMDDAAERLETAALKIDELAERVPQRGVGLKAGNLAAGVADGLEAVARYLRDNDMRTLQLEVGRIASERPLGTVLLAVGAGYVAGKVLR
ncbi:MAG TPA: hypothetical protein VEW03_03605 [Longimicrobiaceae bacterium]|nr:hypothetical protein [Longimicrobiaceae bacterium]